METPPGPLTAPGPVAPICSELLSKEVRIKLLGEYTPSLALLILRDLRTSPIPPRPMWKPCVPTVELFAAEAPPAVEKDTLPWIFSFVLIATLELSIDAVRPAEMMPDEGFSEEGALCNKELGVCSGSEMYSHTAAERSATARKCRSLSGLICRKIVIRSTYGKEKDTTIKIEFKDRSHEYESTLRMGPSCPCQE